MKTTQLLRQRLELVFEWYQGMVNPDTGMLEYLYISESDRFVRENCPIRDIASVWDAEVLGDFLGPGRASTSDREIAQALRGLPRGTRRLAAARPASPGRAFVHRAQRLHDAGPAARAATAPGTADRGSCRRDRLPAEGGRIIQGLLPRSARPRGGTLCRRGNAGAAGSLQAVGGPAIPAKC
jgi:hypothetical protein